MNLYLCRYRGAGTESDPFRPNGTELLKAWYSIDLRVDSTTPEGDCVVATPEVMPGVAVAGGSEQAGLDPATTLYLGDDPQAILPTATVQAVGRRFGLDWQARKWTVGQMLAELLIGDADAKDPKKRNPLLPDRGRYRIHLGEEIWSMPVIAGGATYTDDFNRTNSTNLGANWKEVYGDGEISSNKLRTVTAANLYARYEQNLASTNHYAKVDVVALGGASSAPGCLVRCNSPATDDAANSQFYMGRYNHDAGSLRWQVFKNVLNTFTSLAETAEAAPSVTYTQKLEANGSTLKLYLSTTEKVSITDTAITTGTKAGVRTVLRSGVELDNFEAADLSSGITVNLGLVSETDAVHALTRLKTRNLGLITETDEVFAISRSKLYSLGLVSETDSAFALTAQKSRTLGLLVETSEAFALSRLKQMNLGLVTETDSVFSLGRAKQVNLGLATETDALFALTRQKLLSLGLITETDEVFALIVSGGAQRNLMWFAYPPNSKWIDYAPTSKWTESDPVGKWTGGKPRQ